MVGGHWFFNLYCFLECRSTDHYGYSRFYCHCLKLYIDDEDDIITTIIIIAALADATAATVALAIETIYRSRRHRCCR